MPVGTVKCRVFRARKQLQAWLMGDDDGKRVTLAGKSSTIAKQTGSKAITNGNVGLRSQKRLAY